MKLPAQLLAGLPLVCGTTLVTAGIGYVQKRKPPAVLQEVDPVRPPGRRAQAALFEVKTALDASQGQVVRGQVLVSFDPLLAAGRALDSTAPAEAWSAPEARNGPTDWREVLA